MTLNTPLLSYPPHPFAATDLSPLTSWAINSLLTICISYSPPTTVCHQELKVMTGYPGGTVV